MYYYKEELINIIKPDKSDPAAPRVLQETLGGQFGEMRTMMQFFSKALILEGPEGFPVPLMPEMPDEHNPGLKKMNN